jgi:hypothetical protein
MPRRYQVIPYEVEAIQLTPESIDRAEIWSGGQRVTEVDAIDHTQKFVALNIPTMTGVKRAQQGDYVVKHGRGQIEVMSERQFQQTYQLVSA